MVLSAFVKTTQETELSTRLAADADEVPVAQAPAPTRSRKFLRNPWAYLLSWMANKQGQADPLLGGDVEERREAAGPGTIWRNFIIMCLAFSVNHGCVVSCLAYSSTMLGSELGGYGSGCLYVFYALTAFFLSKPVVSMIGPRLGLFAGTAGYCIYVGGFLFAVMVADIPQLAWPVFLTAASVGGIAGGLLWTSQGRYFARNAKVYAEVLGEDVSKVNATFAGVFATAYLGLEMVTKVLATVVFLTATTSAPFIIFSIYTVLAVLAAMVILTLSTLDELGSWDWSWSTIMTNVGATASLTYEDSRLSLLLPFQIAFGFASSFVPYYVFGTVIAESDELGSTWVGLLSAVIVLTGALMALPSAWAANKFGKPVVMALGGLCLAFAGFIFFVLSDEQLGTWRLIVPFLAVYGMGRGTWENTNKVRVRCQSLSLSLFFFFFFFFFSVRVCALCSRASPLTSPHLLPHRTGRGRRLLHRHARALHRRLRRRQLQQRPGWRHRLLHLRRGQQAYHGWPRHGHQPRRHRLLPHRQPYPSEPANHEGGTSRQISVLGFLQFCLFW